MKKSANKLTQEEFNAFAGLDAGYEEMDKKLQEAAPRCHCKPMDYVQGDETVVWWECLTCGHTKEVN